MNILEWLAKAGVPAPDADYGTPDWAISILYPGVVVTDDSELTQAVEILANTALGTCALVPEKGTRIARYIDQPLNKSLGPLIADITAVLGTYEPRVKVISVVPTVAAAGAGTLTINFRRADSANGRTLTTTFAIL